MQCRRRWRRSTIPKRAAKRCAMFSPAVFTQSKTLPQRSQRRKNPSAPFRRRSNRSDQHRESTSVGSDPERLLVLPVHGMRLHIHHEVGSGDGLFGSYQRDKEPITVTPAEIIYQRRIAVLDHAARTGNVAETCRIFGISRTRFYQWKNVADRYGLDALVPKGRRTPQMPEATPTHVVQSLLTLAVLEPTIGCRQYADRLGDLGFSIAKSTVQKHLVAHGLGKRSQRLARAAAITAATTGLLTDAARDEHLFGFCLATGGPGELVCLDSFYIGKLKGVGKVYQL